MNAPKKVKNLSFVVGIILIGSYFSFNNTYASADELTAISTKVSKYVEYNFDSRFSENNIQYVASFPGGSYSFSESANLSQFLSQDLSNEILIKKANGSYTLSSGGFKIYEYLDFAIIKSRVSKYIELDGEGKFLENGNSYTVNYPQQYKILVDQVYTGLNVDFSKEALIKKADGTYTLTFGGYTIAGFLNIELLKSKVSKYVELDNRERYIENGKLFYLSYQKGFPLTVNSNLSSLPSSLDFSKEALIKKADGTYMLTSSGYTSNEYFDIQTLKDKVSKYIELTETANFIKDGKNYSYINNNSINGQTAFRFIENGIEKRVIIFGKYSLKELDNLNNSNISHLGDDHLRRQALLKMQDGTYLLTSGGFLIIENGSLSSREDGIVEMTKFSENLAIGINDRDKKIKIIFDWISKNIKYDYQALAITDKMNINSPTAQELIALFQSSDELSVFSGRKGVCVGYANLFKFMLNANGITDVEIKSGTVLLPDDTTGSHAWNKVGNMYFDATWDQGSGYWFNLPEDVMNFGRIESTDSSGIAGLKNAIQSNQSGETLFKKRLCSLYREKYQNSNYGLFKTFCGTGNKSSDVFDYSKVTFGSNVILDQAQTGETQKTSSGVVDKINQKNTDIKNINSTLSKPTTSTTLKRYLLTNKNRNDLKKIAKKLIGLPKSKREKYEAQINIYLQKSSVGSRNYELITYLKSLLIQK